LRTLGFRYARALLSARPQARPARLVDERDFRAVAPLSGGSFTLLPRDAAGP
jgi:hypothetical protein